MALYLGSLKKNLNVGLSPFKIIVDLTLPISEGIRLKSSDDKILKDKNDIYITAKEDN